MQTPILVSVNVGKAVRVPWADQATEDDWEGAELGHTAIDKQPVTARVAAGRLGLAGDQQANTKHHGGVDQAVYAYAREDLDWWAAELGRPLRPGQFGENLTTAGVDVTGAVIGERWRVGSTVLEVSRPRIPCTVFQAWLGEPKWVRRFTDQGWPGAYLRVLDEGELGAGDPIVVEHRPAHGVTIGETFRALTGDRSLAPRLLEAPELPAALHDRVRTWLGRPGSAA
jgi:MOSC domain-containing protein YiiM